jgi:hypothetical protein
MSGNDQKKDAKLSHYRHAGAKGRGEKVPHS